MMCLPTLRAQSQWLLTLGLTVALAACSPSVKEDPDTGGGGTTGGATDSAGGTGAGVCTAPSAAFTGTGSEQGEKFGDFTLDDCEGVDTSASDVMCEGRVLLVYFGAGWCQPCREKQPKLKELFAKYESCGLRIVEVLREDSGPNDPATKTFCKQWRDDDFDLPFPVTVDPLDKVTATYLGSGTFPIVLLVDQEGTIRLKEVGADSADLEALIQDLTGC